MILRFLPAILLFTASAHAADFDRTLPVSAPVDLFVSSTAGRIQIVPSDGNSVHIRAHLTGDTGFLAGNRDDVEQRMRRISEHPPIRQSGISIHIGDSSADRALLEHITIHYQISVPRMSALYLHTSAGDIEVDNVGRSLKADSSAGSVRAHNLAGPADLHSDAGDVELEQTAPGNVKATTGSGSIRVFGLSGNFIAQSGSGDIEVGGHLAGKSHLSTGSGSIRMHLGQDARINLDASTGTGVIRAPGIGSGRRNHVVTAINGGGTPVEAQTGTGDIEVN